MKKRLPLILLLLLAAGGGYIYWRYESSRPFDYAGTIEADEVDISPQVSSVIASYEVKGGDTVKKGQTLVELSCDDIRIQADQSDTDYQRALRLYKAGSMPKSSYDRANFAHQDAALRLSWCDVTSPMDGTVLETYREPGEWVAPGMNLLTLANLKSVYAILYIPQPMLARVSPGEKVDGFLPETPGSRFQGYVEHIREEAEFTPKNVQTQSERTRLVYGIKVHFDNPDEILKPGMTIEARLPETRQP